jgi:hypothetical protein
LLTGFGCGRVFDDGAEGRDQTTAVRWTGAIVVDWVGLAFPAFAADSVAGSLKPGLRRVQRVARSLRDAGVDASYLFIERHGDGGLLVATGPRTAEPLNRRVEAIVRQE